MARLLYLVALFSGACAVAGAKIRIAAYDGDGAYPQSGMNTMRDSGWGDRITVSKVYPDDILKGALNDFDIVFFPGGSGSGQARSLGDEGLKIVRDFVREGGAYLGICGGAFLGITGNYDDSPKDPWEPLGLLRATRKSPYDRGGGNVTVEFFDEGFAAMGLPRNSAPWNEVPVHEDVGVGWMVYYNQGPITIPNATAEGHSDEEWLYAEAGEPKVLANFTSEINIKKPDETTGQMVNTPAVLSTHYGKGRVLVTSPHPENANTQQNYHLQWMGGYLSYLVYGSWQVYEGQSVVGNSKSTCSANDFGADLANVQCRGLKQSSAATTESACVEACCDDASCSAWQFRAGDGCWIGAYTSCVDGSSGWVGGGERAEPPSGGPPSGVIEVGKKDSAELCEDSCKESAYEDGQCMSWTWQEDTLACMHRTNEAWDPVEASGHVSGRRADDA